MLSHPHLHWFKAMLGNKDLIARLKNITFVITDVDGSLTDGTVHYSADGEGDRMYAPQDGYAIRMAIDSGIKIALLSGNAGASITSRARKLRIPENLITLGSHDKRAAVKNLQIAAGAKSEQTLVFGDDYLDAAVKEADKAITFIMPNNGIFYLQPIADCVVPVSAGQGAAFRMILDLMLYVQGKHLAQHLIASALEYRNEKERSSFAHSA